MHAPEHRHDGDSPVQAGLSKGAPGTLGAGKILGSGPLLARFGSVTVDKWLDLSEHRLLPLLGMGGPWPLGGRVRELTSFLFCLCRRHSGISGVGVPGSTVSDRSLKPAGSSRSLWHQTPRSGMLGTRPADLLGTRHENE